MEKRESRMHLPTIDDIFTTQEERDSRNNERVVDISLNEIVDFPNHPFKVLENAEMNDMVESIKDKGVLIPAIVRKKADGKYEMISGHRRKRASELALKETIPCIVRDLSDDEATIIMVDSNLQREKILPSEKAFAYKMKLEAIKHQGSRTDLTSTPVVEKLSVDKISKNVGESREQVRRYIRLTELIPSLLQLVDNDALGESPSMALRPAVELSYLTKEEQTKLSDIIDTDLVTPSHGQAIDFKKLSQEGKLTAEYMKNKLSELKPNQTPALKVSMNRLNHVLPPSLKNDREREEYIIKAVEWYDKYQKKLKERNSQDR